MRLLKQAFAVFGALVLLAAVVAFAAPKRTQALVAALVQIVPGTTTHVGQNESRLVWLDCIVGNNFCNSVDSEGNVSNTAYVIPSGYTLVVMDYEWSSSAVCGRAGDLSIDALSNADNMAHLSPASYSVADGNGNAYAHEHYSTGIRVGSGVTVGDFNATINCGLAYVQGYLVPND